MWGNVAVTEQGQLVHIRHRHFLVQDEWPRSVQPRKAQQYRVRLDAMDYYLVGDGKITAFKVGGS